MKRIVTLLIAAFLIFSCADGSSDDSNPAANDNMNIAPVLLGVTCYKYDNGSYTEADYLNVDDQYTFELSIMDFDKDIVSVELSVYTLSGQYEGPETSDLPEQKHEVMEFRMSTPGTVDDPPGEYTLYFKLIDSRGNESNSYSIDLTVLAAGEDPPPDPWEDLEPWAHWPDILKYTEDGNPEYEDTYYLSLGDQYIWEISASDDQMDITHVKVTLYSTADGYSEPELIDLPTQTHNPMSYKSDLMIANMPIGQYKYYFTFIDSKGNESDETYAIFRIEE